MTEKKNKDYKCPFHRGEIVKVSNAYFYCDGSKLILIDAHLINRSKKFHDIMCDLTELINEHRSKEILTCTEDCWCWDIEAITMKYEEE